MSLPPPPTAPPDPYLTEEEIQFLEEDRQRVINETNKKLAFHSTNVKAKAVKKSKVQESKDREAFLSFIRKKFQAADPIAKENFSQKVEGVDYLPGKPSVEEVAIAKGIIKVHRPVEKKDQ